jgi:hypothetical protein
MLFMEYTKWNEVPIGHEEVIRHLLLGFDVVRQKVRQQGLARSPLTYHTGITGTSSRS